MCCTFINLTKTILELNIKEFLNCKYPVTSNWLTDCKMIYSVWAASLPNNGDPKLSVTYKNYCVQCRSDDLLLLLCRPASSYNIFFKELPCKSFPKLVWNIFRVRRQKVVNFMIPTPREDNVEVKNCKIYVF